VLFTQADAHGWPSRGGARVVLRDGRWTQGEVPPAWRTSHHDALTAPA